MFFIYTLYQKNELKFMGKKLKLDEFIEKCKLKHGDKYDYTNIKEYINIKEYYTIKCIKHDLIFKIKGDMHLEGKGCRECKRENLSKIRRSDLEYVLSLFTEKHGDKYDYSNIKEYINCDEKVSIICKTHGIFEQSSRNHWNGQGCVKCYNDTRHTKLSSNIDEFIKRSKMIHGDKYDYSKSIYKNNKTKLEIICKYHGSFFKNPNNHINGDKEGCPRCASSYGESKIYSILKGNDINFINQKKFEDCLYKNHLRFDFYLPEYNMCIEYNGEQHYKSIDFFGGDKQHELNKIRDNIKEKYCINNNINLVIIKYDDNILDMLIKSLNIKLDDKDIDHMIEKYLPYESAVDLLSKSNIKTQNEYRDKYKYLNNKLPSHPDSIYSQWTGWSDYLTNKGTQKQRDCKGRFMKKER